MHGVELYNFSNLTTKLLDGIGAKRPWQKEAFAQVQPVAYVVRIGNSGVAERFDQTGKLPVWHRWVDDFALTRTHDDAQVSDILAIHDRPHLYIARQPDIEQGVPLQIMESPDHPDDLVPDVFARMDNPYTLRQSMREIVAHLDMLTPQVCRSVDGAYEDVAYSVVALTRNGGFPTMSSMTQGMLLADDFWRHQQVYNFVSHMVLKDVRQAIVANPYVTDDKLYRLVREAMLDVRSVGSAKIVQLDVVQRMLPGIDASYFDIAFDTIRAQFDARDRGSVAVQATYGPLRQAMGLEYVEYDVFGDAGANAAQPEAHDIARLRDERDERDTAEDVSEDTSNDDAVVDDVVTDDVVTDDIAYDVEIPGGFDDALPGIADDDIPSELFDVPDEADFDL